MDIKTFFETLFPDLGGGFIELRFLGTPGSASSFSFPTFEAAVAEMLPGRRS